MADPLHGDDVPSSPMQTTASAPDRAQARALAATAGWSEPQAYDYGAYGVKIEGADTIEHDAAPFQYASEAPRYEWATLNPESQDEEIGPRNEALEQQLFPKQFINTRGDLFNHLLNVNVDVVEPEGVECPAPAQEFADMGLHPLVIENIKMAMWMSATPIQQFVIPMVLKGFDVVGIAQTGTGKTGAYLLPIISHLFGKAKKLCAPRPGFKGNSADQTKFTAEPLALIIVPTRELAIQIFDTARKFCYRSMLRPCAAYGGARLGGQIEELRKGCDLLICTMGRLMDLVRKPHILSLRRLKFTVLDEGDELMGEDWKEELTTILLATPAEQQFLMFSATFPRDLRKVARDYLSPNNVRIRVGPINAISDISALKQSVIQCDRDRKNEALYDLLMLEGACVRTMVFVNSAQKADLVDDYLYNNGMPCTSIHSLRNQQEREDALRGFRHGHSPILVTTAVTARGLDIKNVLHIINYDMPSVDHGGIVEYIHRAGRTARIGNQGRVTSLLTDRDMDIAGDLTKLLMQSGAEVPAFLEEYKPTDNNLAWEDDDEWANLSEFGDAAPDADAGGGSDVPPAFGADDAVPAFGEASNDGFAAQEASASSTADAGGSW